MLLLQPTTAPPRSCSSSGHRRHQRCASTTPLRLGIRPCRATGDQPKQQQEEEQQPTYPPGYDPSAAAGFLPLPGEQPLWWVKKFEKMRLELAQEQAAAAAAAVVAAAADGDSSGGASAAASPARPPLPTGNTALPRASDDDFDDSPAPPPTPQLLRSAALQLLQLLLAVAALILWPASLQPGALAAPRTWLLFACYIAFFAGGSVYRLLRYGPLAARQRDAQGKTWRSRAAWALFVGSIPVIHFPPMREFFSRPAAAVRSSSGGGLCLYDVLGGAMLAAALALNWWAARTLGRAYDRVVTPERLITSGPYSHIQHPIYTSYMLLFAGYAMVLHSGQTALWALVVCLIYYRSRGKLEAALLEDAFGPEYKAYRKRTRLFVPFLM